MSCGGNCGSTKSFKGQKGDSAYQIWLADGNSGTEAQFLASLIGTDGTNGIYLLYNNITPVITTGVVLQNLMTYTLLNANASTTPFENGDVIVTEARITSDGLVALKSITHSFDGQQINLAGLTGFNSTSVKFKNTITRVSATSIISEGEVTLINGFTTVFSSGNIYSNAIPPISNLDTTDVVIGFQGDGAVVGDITQQYLRVYLIKQP